MEFWRLMHKVLAAHTQSVCDAHGVLVANTALTVVAAPNDSYDFISRKYECQVPVFLVLVIESLLTKFLVTECLVPRPNA